MTLKKAYDAIMDKIEVTPAMRERVLKRVAAEHIPITEPRVLHFPKRRSYLLAAACLLLIVTGALLMPRLPEPEPVEPPPVLLAPNMEETASLPELSELVGFEVTEDFVLPFQAEETGYLAWGRDLAQVTYTAADRNATYRQSAGTEDNSGDYTVYGDVAEITVRGLPVTLKGDGGIYRLAVWTDGTFSYSLYLSQGASEAEWLDRIFADAGK